MRKNRGRRVWERYLKVGSRKSEVTARVPSPAVCGLRHPLLLGVLCTREMHFAAGIRAVVWCNQRQALTQLPAATGTGGCLGSPLTEADVAHCLQRISALYYLLQLLC